MQRMGAMPEKRSFADVHTDHRGKVSDKWSFYLQEYERLLSPIRSKKVSVLEIGVQNGGSLEIWNEYFSNSISIVGCDIDEKCSQLVYEDPKVQVVVGDVLTEETQTRILKIQPNFDLIIDDGSHNSLDIIKTFLGLFKQLNSDGIYIIEDLHCSYWDEFQGGLHNPQSAIAFFKLLIDQINEAHWGNKGLAAPLFGDFEYLLPEYFFEDVVSHVRSIEFLDSLCVIRKGSEAEVRLGTRVVTGSVGMVNPDPIQDNGKSSAEFSHSESRWTLPLRIELAREISTKDALLEDLAREISTKDALLEDLAREISTKDALLAEITNTKSWRYTRPFRFLLRRFASFTRPAIRRLSKCIAKYSFIFERVVPLAFMIVFTTPVRYLRSLYIGRFRSTPDDLTDINYPFSDKSAVVFIARGKTNEEIHSIQRFLDSYLKFRPGLEHKLYVVIKGFENQDALSKVLNSLDRVRHEKIQMADETFDIGAYISAAKIVTEEKVLFLNTHSEIISTDWLLKIAKHLEKSNVGLVGCSASFESLHELNPLIPKFPNSHIRTNAFMTFRKLFIDLTEEDKIKEKWDAFHFESGQNSLTRRVENRGYKVVVSGANGVGYFLPQWSSSQTFRLMNQSNLIIGDNQTRNYQELPFGSKLAWTFRSWGND